MRIIAYGSNDAFTDGAVFPHEHLAQFKRRGVAVQHLLLHPVLRDIRKGSVDLLPERIRIIGIRVVQLEYRDRHRPGDLQPAAERCRREECSQPS